VDRIYDEFRAAKMNLVATVFGYDQCAGFRQLRQLRFLFVLSVRQNDEWQRRHWMPLSQSLSPQTREFLTLRFAEIRHPIHIPVAGILDFSPQSNRLNLGREPVEGSGDLLRNPRRRGRTREKIAHELL
jgi:hypothetical protein